MRNLRTFKSDLLKDLQDPEYAKTYLSVALEEYEQDKDASAFLTALRDVAEAQGGLTRLSKRTHLNRQNLYKALSPKGNPRLETIDTLLHGLGFRLDIVPLKSDNSIQNSY
jgi:probable addiction module antidote protein